MAFTRVATVQEISGADKATHYNMWPAADLSGQPAPGFSTGQALATVEKLATLLTEQPPAAARPPIESSLVPIQPAGGHRPLVLFHSLTGGLLYARDLARHLGAAVGQPQETALARREGGLS